MWLIALLFYLSVSPHLVPDTWQALHHSTSCLCDKIPRKAYLNDERSVVLAHDFRNAPNLKFLSLMAVRWIRNDHFVLGRTWYGLSRVQIALTNDFRAFHERGWEVVVETALLRTLGANKRWQHKELSCLEISKFPKRYMWKIKLSLTTVKKHASSPY